MPVAPELLGRAHQIREPEVLHELDAHQLGSAAGNVRVSREVAEDLEGESVDPDEHVDAGWCGVRLEDRVGHAGDVVGHEDLQKEAPRDEPQTVADLLTADPARLVNLRQEA